MLQPPHSAAGTSGVAVDATGDVYVAVASLNQVWVVSPDGAVTEVIGNGSGTFGGDRGPGVFAELN